MSRGTIFPADNLDVIFPPQPMDTGDSAVIAPLPFAFYGEGGNPNCQPCATLVGLCGGTLLSSRTPGALVSSCNPSASLTACE